VREPLTLAVAAFATASSCVSLEDANSLIDRAIACLGEAHPQSDYTVEGQLVVATMLCDRFEEFRELTTTWLQDARRSGSIPRFISMATMRAHYHYRVGELEEAKSDAHDALEAAALYGHHFWVPGSAGALINPLVDQGRLEEAERVLADSRVQERHGHSSSAPWATMLLPARGRLRVAQGRPQEGLQDLLDCGERYESAANRSPSLWAWRSEAALAFLALGEHDRACELAREELDLARGFGAPRALGIALRVAGIVEGSTALLEEAVQVLSGSPAQLESARALVDLGGALRRAGQRTEAREHLRQGLELALRCGADALAERAREELLTSGAHLRRERLSGPEALTPSELRVARMAAVGHTNPEIAQALFLTRRTVETHLTHAYQKLGIGSRRELATALRD
jgi:DNA-binding CsgD family transcriptional regulator